ncbi:MAG: bifunctional 2-C-methyl-D-erythritol 4-phosphate cytidylyltransferase/2-C-methyl-D-erythritol 2,4-cyclodiphosphate synthase [Thermodesulfobium narugense]|nr:MAG: bifunctional 2-C-methyl-D-erythritol 4-phosphate cytidylyltransferase/2-C-methyl-D-erythritol 2,4-cyclodiphosphate synthase [Thermodesulfobium narugense]
MNIWAVIVAAGKGERLGSYKPLIKIGDKYMLEYSVETISKSNKIEGIVVVCLSNYIQFIRELLKKYDLVKYVVPGGKLRQDSVRKGILKVPETAEFVLVHDAARPFVSVDIIERSINAAVQKGSCVVCVGINDTVKRVEDGFIKETLDRDSIFLAQTPQIFKRKELLEAFENAILKRLVFTDESSLMEFHGIRPFVVLGDNSNMKITYPQDLELVKNFINSDVDFKKLSEKVYEEEKVRKVQNYFVGVGEDIHPFDKERPLYLGGVLIPFEKGLKGHSDADVLLHALIDALLGASGLDDIGTLFPDTDPKYYGVSSLTLLQKVSTLVYSKGFKIQNIDMIVFAEKPKIRTFKDEIISVISNTLNIDKIKVNLKGKTAEGLGFLGREEGIYAKAVVLLKKEENC